MKHKIKGGAIGSDGVRYAVALVLVLLGFGAAGGQAAAEDPGGVERWYVVLIEGQRVGWMRTGEKTLADQGRIETTAETRITVRRGGLDMSIAISTAFIETLDGKPIEARSEQVLGRLGTSQVIYFRGDIVEVVTRQGGEGGQEVRRVQPMPVVGSGGEPRGWLSAAAAQRYVLREMDAGAEQIRFWTLDPSMGLQPVHIWMARGESRAIEVYGKTVAATAWDTTLSVLPGVVNREYVDAQGRMVRSSLSVMPGMAFSIVAADKGLAMSPAEPPELMAATLIRPDRRIERARDVVLGRYELRIAGGAAGGGAGGLQIPQTGAQSVKVLEPGKVVVEVSARGSDRVRPGGLTDRRYLDSSVVLNWDDPVVRGLVGRALGAGGDGLDDSQKAERLRVFVHGYIDAKDLSVGFGTAGEVARTGQGDCTEHAVLLAALLRAVGVPSRTVSGLVYVDHFLGQAGVFGYHMWTQGWIEDGQGGRWVDLDASFGEPGFDATHIALATSSMADGSVVNDMVRLVPVFGRLSIRVLDAEGGEGVGESGSR